MSLQLYGDPSRNTRESGASRHDRIAVHADPPRGVAQSTKSVATEQFLAGGWASVALRFEAPYRRGRGVGWRSQDCWQEGQKEGSLVIEATLVHALITSQVRRMRPRSEMFCAGHLGGETSAPCGGGRGIRKGWRAPMACEIAGKGREEMRCESERERKGGSVCSALL